MRITILLSVILLIFTACTQTENETETIDISENETIRDSVFSQILTDPELFNEFMDKMRENHRNMDMMMDYPQMMEYMMQSTIRDSMRYNRWRGMMMDSSFYNNMDTSHLKYMDSMHNRMMNPE